MLYKDLQIPDRRKLSNGQLLKTWKETALVELCFFFIDILAFEPDKLCPGVGILFRFRPRVRSFTLKTVPGAGILMKKISSRGGGYGNRSN